MARYGRIIHGERSSQTNDIKFENVAARREFAAAFEAYHGSHDHDGEPPRFEEIRSTDADHSVYGSGIREWGDKYLTIDGYKAREIREYHLWDGVDRITANPRYRPPTCCISPLIVLEAENIGGDGPLVDSGTLERHALSSIFGDMPEEDFASLLESVQADGFMDNHIRVHQGKILDGWHRYRAALELNIVRKLRFTVWNAEEEGTPEAFVLARNIERRHLSASQRAQVAVAFNERFGVGNIKSQISATPNGEPKSRKELAKQAGVGTSTIDRATQVEQMGRAEEVISGEKTAGEVIAEEKKKVLEDQRQKAQAAETKMWDTLKEVAPDWNKDDFMAAACDRHTWGVTEFPNPMETDIPAIWESRFQLLITEINLPTTWIQELLDKMAESTDSVDVEAVQRDIIKAREKADAENGGMVSFRPIANKYGIDVEEVAQIAQGIAGSSLVTPVEESSESEDLPLQTALDEMKAKSPNMSDREARKLLKRKKQLFKTIWDKRKQVSRDYIGDGNTDLNTYIPLDKLEKAFAAEEAHSFCKNAFESAMARTAFAEYSTAVERMLESDVSEAALEIENRALNTYAFDVLKWEDQDWILNLIEKAKVKAAAKEEPPGDPEKAEALEKFINQKAELYKYLDSTPLLEVQDEFGFINKDKARHGVMLAAYKAYDLPEDLLRNDTAVEEMTTEQIVNLTSKYFLMLQDFAASRADWVVGLYKAAKKEAETDTKIELTPDEELFKAAADQADEASTGECVEPSETQEELDAEGLGGIDVSALRDTLSSLLKKLGVDVNHQPRRELCEDLTDVFLQYEEPPTTQECVIALLDTADSWLVEYDK